MPLDSEVPLLRLYTRDNCSLCERAYPVLERLATEGVVTVDIIDIRGDPTLNDRYGERIPVLEFPSGAVLEGRISEFRIRRLLAATPLGRGEPHDD